MDKYEGRHMMGRILAEVWGFLASPALNCMTEVEKVMEQIARHKAHHKAEQVPVFSEQDRIACIDKKYI